MKFLFIIQGEGRGHMTQAISLSKILKSLGHELCAVCIGKSQRREIPEFVLKNIDAPVFLFESPNFVTDNNHKSINLGKTIWQNLLKIKTFKNSLKEIHELVTENRPDVILNFYDILGGLYNAVYRPECEFWVIGHQYLIDHPLFPFAPLQKIQKLLFQINTKITSWGADQKIALSFRPLKANGKTMILPPLLRTELKNLVPIKGDFILTYMVNHGYAEELLAQAIQYPEIKIEAFWDKKGVPDFFQPLPNVIFHKVNDILFLEKMSQCMALMTTAGFESVCEAMYLGKPVMMVPVGGQYEQNCNALDAKISGAGIIGKSFDFKLLYDYSNSGQFIPTNSRDWADSFQRSLEIFLAGAFRENKELGKEFFKVEVAANLDRVPT